MSKGKNNNYENINNNDDYNNNNNSVESSESIKKIESFDDFAEQCKVILEKLKSEVEEEVEDESDE